MASADPSPEREAPAERAAVPASDAAPAAAPASWWATIRRWPGTRLAFLAVVAVVIIGGGFIWLMQPSPSAAFAVSARTTVVTVEPMCGERLVWDLPAGRVVRRSALPGQEEPRTGAVTLVLMAGSRARLVYLPSGDITVVVSHAEALHQACRGSSVFYEALVDDTLLADDRVGITYGPLTPAGQTSDGSAVPASALSLLLSGHVILGEAVQLGAGWTATAPALLESATIELRVVPWFDRDRVTLRTERLEEGGLLDTHACLDVSQSSAPAGVCPPPTAPAARGFLRTRVDDAMSVQLYTQGALGTQAFGGPQHVLRISESTAAWHSPALTAMVSLLLFFFGFYQAVKTVVKDSIGWWKGSSVVLACVLTGVATASAEPVEIRQGTLVGAGYSFRRAGSCLVVTARHVVPQMGGSVGVLDRTGARAEGTRVYDNEFYDLAMISLPDKAPVACSTPWPDAAWMARASFSPRSEFRAVRHYANGRETLVRLQYAGGVKHLLTLAPADRLTVRESDSGAMVELDGRPAGIVQSVDAGTDRVNVLRFDVIDQLVGDRFRGSSAGPVSYAGVLSRGRINPAWSTYMQSWLAEKAGRSVAPATQGRGAAKTCTVQLDVLAWERLSIPNPDYSAVELQLRACGKRGFLYEQACKAGRSAATTTPRRVLSQKLTINASVTPPTGAAVTRLETTTVVPPSGPALGRAELEMFVLQQAAGPVLTELLSRAPCP